MAIQGTTGDDDLDGTSGDDVFHMGGGGNDTVHGLAGSDTFIFGSTLDVHDHVFGGAGLDKVVLNGGGDVHIGVNTLQGVEGIILTAAPHGYSVTFAANPDAHGQIGIQATLGSVHSVHIDASAETSLHMNMIGADGDDVFLGGHQEDFIVGLGGADIFVPGAGQDIIGYQSVSESTSLTFDTVQGFSVRHDVFAFLSTPVSAVDAPVIGGVLDSHHAPDFNHSLSAAIGGGELGAGEAVIFRPNHGDWAGHTFLIVDANGVPGYQASADFVIELQGHHLTNFSLENFLSGP